MIRSLSFALETALRIRLGMIVIREKNKIDFKAARMRVRLRCCLDQLFAERGRERGTNGQQTTACAFLFRFFDQREEREEENIVSFTSFHF